MVQTKHSRALFILTVAITAACGLVVEIVAGRMLAPYLGMSLYTWTAIIAVVLGGFSAGHWVGGIIADAYSKHSQLLLGWTLLLCSVTTALCLILLRLIAGPVIQAGLSPVETIILLSAGLFFLPSFFVGIPSPILTKLAIALQPERVGATLGAMFAAGAFGSIIGTLLAGFIFISWIGTNGTILIVAGLYLGLAIVFFVRSSAGQLNALISPCIVVFIVGTLFIFTGRAVLAFRSNCTVESDYYCIRVLDISQDAGTLARLMILDHLGHGMNVHDDPEKFLSSYIELTDRIVTEHLGQKTFRAFFVGGGAYTLPRAWTLRRDGPHVTVAELDPAVTQTARLELWLPAGNNLQIHHRDARQFLSVDASAPYDVVIGDAFHDISVPQHLVTLEFFDLVRRRMTASGIYVMTAVDQAQHPRMVLSLYRTMKRVFGQVEIWLDDSQRIQGERSTFILVAGNRLNLSSQLISATTPDRSWSRLSPGNMARALTDGGPIILTDDFAPVDRLISGG